MTPKRSPTPSDTGKAARGAATAAAAAAGASPLSAARNGILVVNARNQQTTEISLDGITGYDGLRAALLGRLDLPQSSDLNIQFFVNGADRLEKLHDHSSFNAFLALQRSVLVVKGPKPSPAGSSADDASVASATSSISSNEGVASRRVAAEFSNSSVGSSPPPPSAKVPECPARLNQSTPFPDDDVKGFTLTKKSVTTQGASGAESKADFFVPRDNDRTWPRKWSRNYRYVYRLTRGCAFTRALPPKRLGMGDNLPELEGKVQPPSAETGWVGVSTWTNMKDMLDEFSQGRQPADAYVFVARTEDLLSLDNLQLMQDPLRPTHFGVCPIESVSFYAYQYFLEYEASQLCTPITGTGIVSVDQAAGTATARSGYVDGLEPRSNPLLYTQAVSIRARVSQADRSGAGAAA